MTPIEADLTQRNGDDVREMVAGDPAAELVIALGRAYHQAGVPSDQLEAIMRFVAERLSLELQVTVLPTSITAAIGPPYAQKVVVLRLEPGSVDLGRLARLNDVYERIAHERVDATTTAHEVEAIIALASPTKRWRTITAYGLLSVGVSIILGGGRHEIVAAAVIGLSTGSLAVVGRFVPAVARLFEVLAAFVATIVVAAYGGGVHPLAVYVPIVAGVVQLLPGFQLTAALHELAYRNLVAGTSRLGGVFITLLALGCGFALGIAVVGPGAFHLTRLGFVAVPWYAISFAVVAVASAIAVLQNARPRDFPSVLLSCAAAEITYRVFAYLPGHQVASFVAALAIGLIAAIGARYARIPQAILLLPGLLILVPGALSYESILFVLQNDAASAAGIAISATIAAIEIVAGLLLSQLFFTDIHRHHHPIRS